MMGIQLAMLAAFCGAMKASSSPTGVTSLAPRATSGEENMHIGISLNEQIYPPKVVPNGVKT
jgi:hypothetical protein